MRKARWILMAAGLVLLGGRSAKAQEGDVFFQQGAKRLSLTAGYGEFNNHSYGVFGAGAGYYFLDGLEAGLDGEAWVGDKPHIYTVSPEMRYVFSKLDFFQPFFGGFFKRTLYDSLPDRSSVGGRAGLISALGPHTYLTGALVYEKYLSCDSSVYDACSLVYPEIGIAFAY